MNKKLVTYLLIVCFGLLIAPKEWLHDCDHSDMIEHHDDGGEEHDCDFCHFDLESGLEPVLFSFTYYGGFHSDYTINYVSNEKETYKSTLDLRGPPSYL